MFKYLNQSQARPVTQVLPVIFVIVVGVILVWLVFIPTSALTTSQKFSIESGESLSAIATALKKQGLIRSSLLFRLYVSGLGLERNLKAGDYVIPAGSTLHNIATQIAGGSGALGDIEVFIPEGSNIWEIDKRLANAGFGAEGQFARTYQFKEGLLFPDTYRFKPGSSASEIEQKLESNGRARTKQILDSLGPEVKNHILIIASIIEKEAKTESDMRLVSGVIANRLKLGVALEIDSTVAYGACLRKFQIQNKDCDVAEIGVGAEIKIDSVFNTYTRAGLPPHPISNPGLTAISATLSPAGDYLYYLSTRDGSRIIFSKTAAEHAANRRKYLGI